MSTPTELPSGINAERASARWITNGQWLQMNITQSSGSSAVNINNHGGTLTFQTGTINATNGTGLQFDNADGTYNFNGTVTLNGGDAGIDILDSSDGTFTFRRVKYEIERTAEKIYKSGLDPEFGERLFDGE